MTAIWKLLNQAQSLPSFLDEDSKKHCCFAREYIACEGYKVSDDNQAIFNFKKPISHKGKADWKYKIAATQLFAKELNDLLSKLANPDQSLTFTTIPTSKLPGHPDFDQRFNEMRDALLELGKDQKGECRYRYEEPISLKESVLSAHAEGGSRDRQEKYNNYQWSAFKGGCPQKFFIIDDVITTGSTFMAYKKLVQEKCPSTIIYGVFWALTKYT